MELRAVRDKINRFKSRREQPEELKQSEIEVRIEEPKTECSIEGLEPKEE
jgi:hypothetical protein